MKSKYTKSIILGILFILFAGIKPLMAQEVTEAEPFISAGNTAWMIVATALVFLMTLPGLAFFYGGLVRRKNILNILMQCFIIAAAITVEWISFGYSMSFGSSSGSLAPFIGGFDWAFLNGIKIDDVSPYYISQATERIPHIIFILFQCMFAVITPALIIGAFAERIKFKGFFIF
ncbi:MAG: ammonium transporter, partial [Prolixibacteraceae bacterium]|nr:ammonium transporter [Prolixibacteraceae bacterium]